MYSSIANWSLQVAIGKNEGKKTEQVKWMFLYRCSLIIHLWEWMIRISDYFWRSSYLQFQFSLGNDFAQNRNFDNLRSHLIQRSKLVEFQVLSLSYTEGLYLHIPSEWPSGFHPSEKISIRKIPSRKMHQQEIPGEPGHLRLFSNLTMYRLWIAPWWRIA